MRPLREFRAAARSAVRVPRWLTTGERGAGFAELADALLAAHSDC